MLVKLNKYDEITKGRSCPRCGGPFEVGQIVEIGDFGNAKAVHAFCHSAEFKTYRAREKYTPKKKVKS